MNLRTLKPVFKNKKSVTACSPISYWINRVNKTKSRMFLVILFVLQGHNAKSIWILSLNHWSPLQKFCSVIFIIESEDNTCIYPMSIVSKLVLKVFYYSERILKIKLYIEVFYVSFGNWCQVNKYGKPYSLP